MNTLAKKINKNRQQQVSPTCQVFFWYHDCSTHPVNGWLGRMIAAAPLTTALIIQAKDTAQSALHHCQTPAAEILTDRLVHLLLTAFQWHRLRKLNSAVTYDKLHPIYILISLTENTYLWRADLRLVKHTKVNITLCANSFFWKEKSPFKDNKKVLHHNDALF